MCCMNSPLLNVPHLTDGSLDDCAQSLPFDSLSTKIAHKSVKTEQSLTQIKYFEKYLITFFIIAIRKQMIFLHRST